MFNFLTKNLFDCEIMDFEKKILFDQKLTIKIDTLKDLFRSLYCKHCNDQIKSSYSSITKVE